LNVKNVRTVDREDIQCTEKNCRVPVSGKRMSKDKDQKKVAKVGEEEEREQRMDRIYSLL